MNRTDLVKALAAQLGVSQVKAKEFLITYEAQVIGALERGEKVQLVGFGTYETVDREARERRNPKTSEVIMCPAYKAPKFKFANGVKQAFKG